MFNAERVDAEFIPVVAVVPNEVGDFAEGLIRYGVLKGHGIVAGWNGRK